MNSFFYQKSLHEEISRCITTQRLSLSRFSFLLSWWTDSVKCIGKDGQLSTGWPCHFNCKEQCMVASCMRISLLFHHLIRPWEVIGIYIRPGRVRYLSQVLGSIRCSHGDEFHIHGQTIVFKHCHHVPFFSPNDYKITHRHRHTHEAYLLLPSLNYTGR